MYDIGCHFEDTQILGSLNWSHWQNYYKKLYSIVLYCIVYIKHCERYYKSERKLFIAKFLQEQTSFQQICNKSFTSL